MTDLYAVIGNPVAQTKSPRIHAEFARQLKQNLRYEAILAPRDGFAAAVAAFRAAGGKGRRLLQLVEPPPGHDHGVAAARRA